MQKQRADYEKDIAHRPWSLSIGGSARRGEGASIDIDNPATGESLAVVPTASLAQLDEAISLAVEAKDDWGARTPAERAAIVRQLADRLEEHAEELAWLDTLDAGLPLWMMRIDAATGISRMRMFADLSHGMLGTSIPASRHGLHLAVPEPFGVVARIIPFNHPFMFAASKLAAPLVAGNAVILKPSELTPLSALRLGEIAAEVLPPGVLSVIHGGAETGDALVRDVRVPRIAFTGSHVVGRAIQRAGADVGIKHVSLELGGKNAMIVCDDADLDAAVSGAVKGMNFAFAGQSCGSNSRVLVHSTLVEAFTEKLTAAVSAVRVGNPWDDGVSMGPVVSARQRERVQGFVERARRDGATIVTPSGEANADAGGHFVSPTIVLDAQPESEIATEEIFGPVVSVFSFETEQEALDMANAVDYGLTASIWTHDLSRAHRMARRVNAGYVWINDSSTHFPGVPFGGVKLSGVGREESLDELLSYTQVKAINVVMS